jgi:hypothetical protein
MLDRASASLGGRGLTLLQVGFAEEDVWRAVERIEPDGFLQRGDGVIPLALPYLRVAQLRERHRVGRVQSDFALRQRYRLVKAASEKRYLAQQRIGLRQLWVLLECLLQLRLGGRSNSSRIIICAATMRRS